MSGVGWRGLPLNGLRAFEAAARHQSFARAAAELSVTPAAISQHVKALEQRVSLNLFRRLPQGIMLTDEGRLLLPTIQQSFGLIGDALAEARARQADPVVTISSVGVFARGWLLPRLRSLPQSENGPAVRVFTHNNRRVSDLPPTDLYVRYGDGRWLKHESLKLTDAFVTPLCHPETARELSEPSDILKLSLFATYHVDEWPRWLERAGITAEPDISATFDSSSVMMSAVMDGLGIGIGSPALFQADLSAGRLVQPFKTLLNPGAAYHLTRKMDVAHSIASDHIWNWLTTCD